ncbi:iron-sulfur protein [Candidatus Geothermarchaeota archaeon]|nr:MAG: iron-sulfur protein [Candidatus Geothermarchaeota archaeon]
MIGIEHFLYVEDIEILVYIFTVISGAIFIYGLYRSYRRWFRKGEKPSFDNFWTRLYNLVKYGLLQRKVVYRPFEGSMHLLIYIGFIILFIGTLIRAFEADITLKFLGYRVVSGSSYLIYKLFLNIGGLLAIIGIIIAFIRRIFLKSENLPDTLSDYLLLLLLLIILITGFVLDGISTLAYRYEWVNNYDFIGLYIADLFKNVENIEIIYRVTWLIHMALAIFSVGFIPYTKLYHIIVGGILNTFFSRNYHPAAFKKIENIDEIIEKGETPGALTLNDLSWKERMDYDACIKCARCTDNCPAASSGKPLSPMDLMLKMRSFIDQGIYNKELIPDYLDKDIIWSCVTCGACVYQCPLLIHHVETILDFRRGLIGKGENVPEELLEVSYNLMRYGNPMGNDPINREEFIKELVDEGLVEIAEEGSEYDYIYWIGCQSTYDPADKEIARSLLKILKKAGLKIAVLPEENCCGEPARRIGDELMFSELVKMNGEILSKYKFKRLVVNCPHGYNIFKHEYPLYGVKIEVIHHTQLLNELIRKGLVKLDSGKIDKKITYHDPCYLGRWNNIFDEPRNILKEVVKNEYLVEMRHNRERSFCCGGGGGHLFFDIKIGERISKIRMNEALETGASILAVACPYCKIMLHSEAGEKIKVMDISEILAEALTEKK